MKLKQIEAILKAEKTIIVSETSACQWLGNGSAFYPVYETTASQRVLAQADKFAAERNGSNEQ